MLSRTIALAVLLLTSLSVWATTGHAQAPKHVTAPRGHLSVPGDAVSNALGGGNAGAGGRIMLGEGTLRGQSLTITRVDYRTQAAYDYDPSNGMGRSFNKVTLTMAHTDVYTMTNASFSANIVGSTTKVFDAKVVWPSLKGKYPQIWGFPVSFPFTTPWNYDGKQDMLLDYNFQGGTLANNGNVRAPYWLDGAHNTTRTWRSTVPQWVPYWPVTGWRCGDSAFPTIQTAYASIGLTLYGNLHWNAVKAGKAEITAQSFYTAPNAPVLGAITMAGHAKGIDVGAQCQYLHVDLTKTVAYVFGKASALTGATTLLPLGPYPYQNHYEGIQLHLQVAWTDSVTRRLGLSVASWIRLPRKQVQLPKKVLYQYSATQLWMTPDQTLPRFQLR